MCAGYGRRWLSRPGGGNGGRRAGCEGGVQAEWCRVVQAVRISCRAIFIIDLYVFDLRKLFQVFDQRLFNTVGSTIGFARSCQVNVCRAFHQGNLAVSVETVRLDGQAVLPFGISWALEVLVQDHSDWIGIGAVIARDPLNRRRDAADNIPLLGEIHGHLAPNRGTCGCYLREGWSRGGVAGQGSLGGCRRICWDGCTLLRWRLISDLRGLPLLPSVRGRAGGGNWGRNGSYGRLDDVRSSWARGGVELADDLFSKQANSQ